jgi:hypothetical protein
VGSAEVRTGDTLQELLEEAGDPVAAPAVIMITLEHSAAVPEQQDKALEVETAPKHITRVVAVAQAALEQIVQISQTAAPVF